MSSLDRLTFSKPLINKHLKHDNSENQLNSQYVACKSHARQPSVENFKLNISVESRNYDH